MSGRFVTCSAMALLGTLIAIYGGAEALRDWRLHDVSALIVAQSAQAPPALKLAAACAVGQLGLLQQALNAYRELQSDSPPAVRHAALFNSGNLYL